MTDSPAFDSQNAVAAPTIPPPMTTASAVLFVKFWGTIISLILLSLFYQHERIWGVMCET
jgi:hypothetical protein